MSVEALLEEVKQAYVQAGLDCGDRLLPPAPAVDIDRVADELSLPVPDDLRAVWRVHGGQENFGAGVSGLFGQHRLLTPAEAIEGDRLIWDCEPHEPPRGTTPRLFNRPVLELVPFASWDAYSLCVHATSGEVWEFLPSPGLLRHRPSIVAVLREILAAVRTGGTAELSWE